MNPTKDRIKILEDQMAFILNSVVVTQEAIRKGTSSTADIVRQDTNEVLKSVQKNVDSLVNETGKGLLVVQGNVSTYIEQLSFFKELEEFVSKLQALKNIDFSIPITPNSPPVWGEFLNQLIKEVDTFAEKLKKVLP